MNFTLPDDSSDFDIRKIGLSMPRERRQQGWVEKTGTKAKTWTGYWYEYVTSDGEENRLRRSRVLGKCAEMTKGAAEAKLNDVIRNFRPSETGAKFEALAAWYLKTNGGRWSEKWNETSKCLFRYQILPRLGAKIASDLKRSDIQQAINDIAADPKSQSTSTVKKCLTHIRAVFNFAIDDELLEKNPALKAELPPTKRPADRFLTLDECQRLLEVGSTRDQLIVRLFMVCGLRPSELFALRVNDVLDGELRIDETIVHYQVSENTKTEGSRANVPLSPELESALRFYILEEKLTDSDFLFPSASGTAMFPDNFLDRVLKPLGKKAGIANLNHQILRRTTATHFQKHGTVKDAQTLLRHSDAQTTLKHYQKVLEASLVAGVASWDAELLSTKKTSASKPVKEKNLSKERKKSAMG
jgi:integrase